MVMDEDMFGYLGTFLNFYGVAVQCRGGLR